MCQRIYKNGEHTLRIFFSSWYLFKVNDIIVVSIWIFIYDYKQRIINWDLIVCLDKFDILRIVVLKLYILRKMIIIATT